MLVWHYQGFYVLRAGTPPIFAHASEQPFYWLLRIFYNYGALAVQLFWAISGFVFASAYIERRVTARQFFVARFARLYPLHFITLLVVAAIQIFSMRQLGIYQFYRYNDIYHFTLNLLFASSWGFEKGFSFNAPIWSVSVEVGIYAVFLLTVPILVRLRLLGPVLLAGAFYLLQRYGPHSLFWQCGYYFYMGVLLYRVVKLTGPWCGALGLGLLLMWRLTGFGNLDTMAPQAIPSLFAGMLLCAASVDKMQIGSGVLRRLAWIGESTYSSYLWHIPVIMITVIAFDLVGVDRLPIISRGWFFLSFIAIVFSIARFSYLHIELPLQAYLRKKWMPGRPTREEALITRGAAPWNR